METFCLVLPITGTLSLTLGRRRRMIMRTNMTRTKVIHNYDSCIRNIPRLNTNKPFQISAAINFITCYIMQAVFLKPWAAVLLFW